MKKCYVLATFQNSKKIGSKISSSRDNCDNRNNSIFKSSASTIDAYIRFQTGKTLKYLNHFIVSKQIASVEKHTAFDFNF